MIKNKFMNEKIAKQILENVCNCPKGKLVCADKPDLQDAIGSCGIEVVEDCYSNEIEAERFVEGIWKKQISEIRPGGIKRLERIGGSIIEENGVVIGASLGKTPNNPNNLIKTIKRKVEKLNGSEYEDFSSYRLYVFVDTVFLFDSNVHNVINVIEEYQNDRERIYEKIYLDGGYEMCICDMRQGIFTRKSIRPKFRNIN